MKKHLASIILFSAPSLVFAQDVPAHHHMAGMAMPEHVSPQHQSVADDPKPAPLKDAVETPAAQQPNAIPENMPAEHDMTHMMNMNMPMNMMQGEGSGTSLLPQADPDMQGLHKHLGGWMAMIHGYAWGIYSDQGGYRGGRQAFVTSMGMVALSRPISSKSEVQFRAMGSLEPLMGERGYPLLFGSGETAYGVPLIDRQHPHNAFMELSARYSYHISRYVSAFIYGGPVAEPALGPSAFMHRASAMYNPEAPISHHWFDSTHISFGVATLGVKAHDVQVETSVFRGREPGENRWTIETPKLDSWSVRASYAPSAHWLASLSYGWLKSPEMLQPDVNQSRTIAALSYGTHSTAITAGWSRKENIPGNILTAWMLEGNQKLGQKHNLFWRIDNVTNDELFSNSIAPMNLAATPINVTKISIGYAYVLPLKLFSLALGGSGNSYVKPTALEAFYGRNPLSYTVFAKLSIDAMHPHTH
jgi:hypothetical protein